jgi:protein-L-isoaspartate(D-aspartate) O-methyltransferase
MSEFAAARANMVDSQVRPSDVTDLFIQDAMRGVAREDLVPAAKRALAYADAEIEYAPGRWMLRPRDVAKLLQALSPRAGEPALAISAPYAAAVLEAMGLRVTACDAAEVEIQAGEWPLIVCEGAVARAPPSWLDRLGPRGRLGVVERTAELGRAMIYVRGSTAVGRRAAFDCTPPFLAGFTPQPGFVF